MNVISKYCQATFRLLHDVPLCASLLASEWKCNTFRWYLQRNWSTATPFVNWHKHNVANIYVKRVLGTNTFSIVSVKQCNTDWMAALQTNMAWVADTHWNPWLRSREHFWYLLQVVCWYKTTIMGISFLWNHNVQYNVPPYQMGIRNDSILILYPPPSHVVIWFLSPHQMYDLM